MRGNEAHKYNINIHFKMTLFKKWVNLVKLNLENECGIKKKM